MTDDESPGVRPAFDLDAFMTLAGRLTADNVHQLAALYAEDCGFRDPFQEVRGRAAVAGIYRHMFKQLHMPVFKDIRLLGSMHADRLEQFVVAWRFEFSFKPAGHRHAIDGCSLLEIDRRGLIGRHVDYWDASLLMQELPVAGTLIRWLRRKIGHAGPAYP
jgi:steroid delta-isomerase